MGVWLRKGKREDGGQNNSSDGLHVDEIECEKDVRLNSVVAMKSLSCLISECNGSAGDSSVSSAEVADKGSSNEC